jgi:4-amino-4-deoxy-L-arabinose transferase-like glycosyltransferase
LLRLATPHLAAQTGWWLPLAIAGVALGLGAWPWRRPLSARQINVAVWAGWALSYGLVFSFAGGVFHTYYVSVLGPPLAALAGIGLALLWRAWRAGRWPLGLPLVLLAVAAWQLRIGHDYVEWQIGDWRSVLLVASVLGLALASAFMARPPRRAPGSARGSVMALALPALLATPLAWALSTVLVRPNVAAPAANIAMLVDKSAEPTAQAAAAEGRPRAARLLEFLAAQHRSERFLLAVPNAMQASPLIVRTGAPIMSMGGYLGRDPILTPADLERMVAGGELRFAIVGGYAIVPPDTRRERALAAWIRAHGQRVDPALWREPVDASRPSPERRPWPSSPARLYGMHPDAALAAD